MNKHKETAAMNLLMYNIGKTNFTNAIQLNWVINLELDKAKNAWNNGLRQKL